MTLERFLAEFRLLFVRYCGHCACDCGMKPWTRGCERWREG